MRSNLNLHLGARWWNLRCDFVSGDDFLLSVIVDLRESDLIIAGQAIGKLFVHGSNSFTGTTPVRVDYIPSVSTGVAA